MFKVVLILIFLLVLIPLVGFIFVIVTVIRKSTEKQSAESLKSEEDEMLAQINSSRLKLAQWKPDLLMRISNNVDFFYSKGISQRARGFIQTGDGQKIIAFRRIDRGFYINSKIIAASSDFTFFFRANQHEIQIYNGNNYLGRILNNTFLEGPSGERLGQIDRNSNSSPIYSVWFRNERIAEVIKNADRRTLVKNPFYNGPRPSINNMFGKEPFLKKEVTYENSMVNILKEIDQEQYNWILALVLFEVVYYSIDFPL